MSNATESTSTSEPVIGAHATESTTETQAEQGLPSREEIAAMVRDAVSAALAPQAAQGAPAPAPSPDAPTAPTQAATGATAPQAEAQPHALPASLIGEPTAPAAPVAQPQAGGPALPGTATVASASAEAGLIAAQRQALGEPVPTQHYEPGII